MLERKHYLYAGAVGLALVTGAVRKIDQNGCLDKDDVVTKIEPIERAPVLTQITNEHNDRVMAVGCSPETAIALMPIDDEQDRERDIYRAGIDDPCSGHINAYIDSDFQEGRALYELRQCVDQLDSIGMHSFYAFWSERTEMKDIVPDPLTRDDFEIDRANAADDIQEIIWAAGFEGDVVLQDSKSYIELSSEMGEGAIGFSSFRPNILVERDDGRNIIIEMNYDEDLIPIYTVSSPWSSGDDRLRVHGVGESEDAIRLGMESVNAALEEGDTGY